MNKDILRQILKTESMPFSSDEVEQLMDEELEKEPDEIDTELIDMCLEILQGNKKENRGDKTENKFRKITLKKILLISAIVALIITVVIPVSADILNIDASDKVVQFFETHFAVNFSENDSVDLALQLKDYGLEDVYLPEVFYDRSLYKVTDFKYEKVGVEDYWVNFSVEGAEDEENGIISLSVIDDNTYSSQDKFKVSSEFNYVKQLKAYGNDVIVFFENSHCYIVYIFDSVKYNIDLSKCTFEKAVEIAETIVKGY